MKKKSVVSDYILWTTVVIVALTLISVITTMYYKSKKVAQDNPIPDVNLLKNQIYAVKTPQGIYKISLNQQLKIDNVKTLKFVIKDGDGNVICTCYYRKNGLVCDNNCTVSS